MYAWALVQGSVIGVSTYFIEVLPNPRGSDISVEAESSLGLTLTESCQAIGFFVAINPGVPWNKMNPDVKAGCRYLIELVPKRAYCIGAIGALALAQASNQ